MKMKQDRKTVNKTQNKKKKTTKTEKGIYIHAYI